MHQFKHPDYACHKAQLLEGASLREREVDDFEIFNVERKLFQGESALKTVNEVLGIEVWPETIYKNLAAQKVKLGKRSNPFPAAEKVEAKRVQVEEKQAVGSGIGGRLLSLFKN